MGDNMGAEKKSTTKPWHEILASLTPLIVGICVTGVGTFFSHVYNDRQLQLNQLTALDKFRPLLISENPFDREFAYASFVALGYEELALKLMQLKQDSAGRAVAQDIAASSSGAAKSEASAALEKIPAQVYLHIADEGQRDKAKAVQQNILEKGFTVPGIENVSGRAELPRNTSVRYFNEQDKASAESIVNSLKSQGLNSASAKYYSGLKARPGSIEVWMSPGDR